MLILIADAFDAALPAKLARFGEVTDDPARLPEAEVVLIRSKSKCTAEWFAGAPKVKLVIRGGVGMDNIDREYAKAHGIKAVNTPKASSIAVAELAFAMMLAVPNRLVEAHNSTAAGQFLKKELKRTELFGKTLGLIGIGNIAREVAKRAKAFGMTVNYYDPFVPSSDVADGEAVARGAGRRRRLHLDAHPVHARDGLHDQRRPHRQDEEGRRDREHRPRQVRERRGHGRRPEQRPGRLLRHRRLAERPAAGGLPHPQGAQRPAGSAPRRVAPRRTWAASATRCEAILADYVNGGK